MASFSPHRPTVHIWRHSFCSGFIHSTEWFAVAATVSAVSSIISPSLCLHAFPHVGRLAKQAHHPKTIHSSQQPTPLHSFPLRCYYGDCVWSTDNKKRGLPELQPTWRLRSTNARSLWVSEWGHGREVAEVSERERKSLKTESSDGTIRNISHFFWYAELMIHQKSLCSTVVDVDAGNFVLSRQNHESSGLSTSASRRK